MRNIVRKEVIMGFYALFHVLILTIRPRMQIAGKSCRLGLKIYEGAELSSYPAISGSPIAFQWGYRKYPVQPWQVWDAVMSYRKWLYIHTLGILNRLSDCVLIPNSCPELGIYGYFLTFYTYASVHLSDSMSRTLGMWQFHWLVWCCVVIRVYSGKRCVLFLWPTYIRCSKHICK